jgi:RNA polymerase sigma-54 factor
MLKPALQLKLGQQLTMTPQLQQAIKLLQLPVLELQAQVQQTLRPTSCSRDEEESRADARQSEQTVDQQPRREGREEEVASSGPWEDAPRRRRKRTHGTTTGRSSSPTSGATSTST